MRHIRGAYPRRRAKDRQLARQRAARPPSSPARDDVSDTLRPVRTRRAARTRLRTSALTWGNAHSNKRSSGSDVAVSSPACTARLPCGGSPIGCAAPATLCAERAELRAAPPEAEAAAPTQHGGEARRSEAAGVCGGQRVVSVWRRGVAPTERGTAPRTQAAAPGGRTSACGRRGYVLRRAAQEARRTQHGAWRLAGAGCPNHDGCTLRRLFGDQHAGGAQHQGYRRALRASERAVSRARRRSRKQACARTWKTTRARMSDCETFWLPCTMARGTASATITRAVHRAGARVRFHSI
jgi:hypothetical protein